MRQLSALPCPAPFLHIPQSFLSFRCKQLIESTPPSELLTQQEYKELSDAVDKEVTASGQTSQTGDEGDEGREDEVKEKKDKDKEGVVREKAMERRVTVHEICKVEVEKRVHFEDGVSWWSYSLVS